jgi:spore coat polysaccharide biosynthesis protein SpsF
MILAILQARVSSTRLPGKVLKAILGKPMLARQNEPLTRAHLIDRLAVATSRDPSDDEIGGLCNELGVPCFRGSLDDVLDRFYQAAKLFRPDHVVRLTGDCPLTDPGLIDQIVQFYLEGSYDYASNTLESTFPDGLDVEVFRFTCLVEAWQEAILSSHREHVTPFICGHPERYRLACFKNATNLSSLRWTVDEPADFELVRRIYEALYPANPEFTTTDILSFLDANPTLKTWNTNHRRNEGLQKSLGEDQGYLRQAGRN